MKIVQTWQKLFKWLILSGKNVLVYLLYIVKNNLINIKKTTN